MSVLALPSSPNWYCSRAIDINDGGIIAFASRHNVVLMRLKDHPSTAAACPFYLASLNVHKERVAALGFSRFVNQTSSLATVADDQQVCLTDVISQTTTVLHREHKNKPTCLCWTRRSDEDLAVHVVSGDDGGVLISVNVASKKTRSWRPSRGAITDVASCPDQAHLVAVGYQGGLILVVDVLKDAEVMCSLRHHDADVQSVCWAPFNGVGPLGHLVDGDDRPERLLASSSRDQTVRVWSVRHATPILTLAVPSGIGVPQRRHKDDRKGQLWVTVAWPETRPDLLLSSSPSGAMLGWDLRSRARNPWSLFGQKEDRQHTRAVFNVAFNGALSCTVSMDRQLTFWQTSDGHQLLSLSTLGGFAYCLTFSPVNSGVLAVGCGDCMLRTWNMTTVGNPYDVATFWQGIKSKVTTLSWHPKKEAILAYGTEEGRVGICNVLSNKPPVVFPTSHRRVVYRVCWGPACPTQGSMASETSTFQLYSCGDGRVYIHNPQAEHKMAVDLNKHLAPFNKKQLKRPNRTEVAWNPDFTVLAVGNCDGSVEVYAASTLRLVAVLCTHSHLIQCLSWHPLFTLASATPSSRRRWLAVASKDPVVHVHDLTFDVSPPEDYDPLRIVTCAIQLAGHGSPVTSVAWNPHLDGQLVTTSFDHTVRVWNVAERVTTACFCGHSGRVLAAEWSPLDPDVIVSGGEDFTVQLWKVSEQDAKPSAKVAKDIERMQKKFTKKPKKVTVAGDLSVGIVDPNAEIERLLSERKSQLMAQGEDGLQPNGDATFEPKAEVAPAVSQPGADTPGQKIGSQPATKRKRFKKKSVAKSMFPLSSTLENRGKAFSLDDCMALADSGRSDSTASDFGVGPRANLGMYGGRVDAYKLLKSEAEHHVANDNLDYALQLEVWKGNLAGALKMAAENEQLSDWLVSLAVTVSPSFWSEMCSLYVRQLVSDGQPHKAVLYLLADHKVHEAVDILKTHVSYKEAVILAKVRLLPKDQLIPQLMDEWAEQLLKEGNVEGAAKCYLGAGQPDRAASILSRKHEPPSSRVGAYVATRLGTDPDAARSYADLGMLDCLLSEDYVTADVLFAEHSDLKIYRPVVRVLRFLHATWRQHTEGDIGRQVDEPLLDVVGRMVTEDEAVVWDGREPDWERGCGRLSSCPVVSTPQKQSEVMAHLAVLMTTSVLRQRLDDPAGAQRHLLDALITVHQSGDVSRLVWLDRILCLDLSTLEAAYGPSSAAIRAYLSLARLHAVLDRERRRSPGDHKNSMLPRDDSVPCPCAKMAAVAGSLRHGLLLDDLAELTRLKTRLTYTKVALASAVARSRGKPDPHGTGVSDVAIVSVPADRLIEHPAITVADLHSECSRLEDQLTTQVIQQACPFPDPFESALLLAEFCALHLRDRCRCPHWGQLLTTAVSFGRRCVALQRQTEKLSPYEAILEAEGQAGMALETVFAEVKSEVGMALVKDEDATAEPVELKGEEGMVLAEVKGEAGMALVDVGGEVGMPLFKVKGEADMTLTEVKGEPGMVHLEIKGEARMVLPEVKGESGMRDKGEVGTAVVEIKGEVKTALMEFKEEAATVFAEVKGEAGVVLAKVEDEAGMVPVEVKGEAGMMPVEVKVEAGMVPVEVKGEVRMAPVEVKDEAEMAPFEVKDETGMATVEVKSEAEMVPVEVKGQPGSTLMIEGLES